MHQSNTWDNFPSWRWPFCWWQQIFLAYYRNGNLHIGIFELDDVKKSPAELFNLEKFSILHNYYFEEVCYPTELFHSIELWNSRLDKGQLISKANCQAEDSSKKRTNEFVFTSIRRVFVRFFEESSAREKTFRDYLTFKDLQKKLDSLFHSSSAYCGLKGCVERIYFCAWCRGLQG